MGASVLTQTLELKANAAGLAAPSTSEDRRLVKNATLNATGRVVSLLLLVVTLPYVVNTLGPERYAVLAIVRILLGYFSVLDLGLGRATTKFVAEALARREPQRIGAIVGTSVLLVGLLGLGGAILFGFLTPSLADRFFTIPADARSEMRLVLYASAAGVFVALARSAFVGVLEAYQRFDLLNLIYIPSAALSALVPVIVLLMGGGLLAVVVAMVATEVAVLCVYPLVCLRAAPELRRLSVDMPMMRPMFVFGGWLTVQNIVSWLLQYLEPTLIAVLLPLAEVTFYSVPNSAATVLAMLPASIMPVLFPAFTALGVLDKVRGGELCWRWLRYLTLLLCLPMLLLIVFGEELLVLWLGPNFTRSGLVLQILAPGVVFAAVSWLLSTFLMSSGAIKSVTVVAVGAALFEVVCAFLMIRLYGIAGAALAFGLARAVIVAAFYAECVRRDLIRVKLSEIGRLASLAAACVVLAGAGLLIKASGQPALLAILSSGLVCTAGYAVFGLYGVLTRDDRVAFFASVNSGICRLRGIQQ